MMDKRGFLQAMLAACAAIVRASSLMKVRGIIIPTTKEVFDFSFTSKDLALSIDDFSKRVLLPFSERYLRSLEGGKLDKETLE